MKQTEIMWIVIIILVIIIGSIVGWYFISQKTAEEFSGKEVCTSPEECHTIK